MIRGIFAIIRGMGITFKHMLMNIATNRFTVQYPKQKRVLPDRQGGLYPYSGMRILRKDALDVSFAPPYALPKLYT